MSNRWVVKLGSNMLVSGGPLLIRDLMNQVHFLIEKRNIEIVWVTSGAIATARNKLNLQKLKVKTKLPEKQALSAIGQPLVMDLYNLALQSTGLKGAQVLLTYEDLANSDRLKNFQNTIDTLLKWKVLPVLNENDAVSTQEIQFGDNDTLSAKVARAIGADTLILLTDVDGLYDSDPSKSQKANRITHLSAVTAKTLKMAGQESSSGIGSGGMYSKLLAAREAHKSKVRTFLVKGDRAKTLISISEGINPGTLIYG